MFLKVQVGALNRVEGGKKSLIRNLTDQHSPTPSRRKSLVSGHGGTRSSVPRDWRCVWNISGTEEGLNERMAECPCLVVLSSSNQNLPGYLKADSNDSVTCKTL